MKSKNIIYQGATIAFYILSILAIIMIILKLTNHSPTMDQTILTVMGIGIAILVKQQYDVGGIKGELKHLNRKVDSIGYDLKQHLKREA